MGDASDVSSGLGLRGLEARLAVLGGQLEVESAPGEGTVLVAQPPVGAAGPDAAAGPDEDAGGKA